MWLKPHKPHTCRSPIAASYQWPFARVGFEAHQVRALFVGILVPSPYVRSDSAHFILPCRLFALPSATKYLMLLGTNAFVAPQLRALCAEIPGPNPWSLHGQDLRGHYILECEGWAETCWNEIKRMCNYICWPPSRFAPQGEWIRMKELDLWTLDKGKRSMELVGRPHVCHVPWIHLAGPRGNPDPKQS